MSSGGVFKVGPHTFKLNFLGSAHHYKRPILTFYHCSGKACSNVTPCWKSPFQLYCSLLLVWHPVLTWLNCLLEATFQNLQILQKTEMILSSNSLCQSNSSVRVATSDDFTICFHLCCCGHCCLSV